MKSYLNRALLRTESLPFRSDPRPRLGGRLDPRSCPRHHAIPGKTVQQASSGIMASPAEPGSPMARLWMQRGLEDVDFVIHVLLSLAPRTDSAPGSPGFDTSQLRSLLLDHVAALPRFSSLMVKRKLRWGFGEEYAWVPTEVDVDNHVREVALGGTTALLSRADEEHGDNSGTVPVKDCVLAYVEDQTMVPLRRDIPLWEVQVISHPPIKHRGVGETYKQSLLWRIHHSFGDGVALAGLIVRLTRTASGVPPSPWELPLPSALSEKQTVPKQLSWVMSYVANSLVYTVQLLLLLVSRGDPPGGCKAPDPSSIRPAKRGIARIVIPMSEAKRAARACGATLNDLLLCLTSSAVHWYRMGRPELQPAPGEGGGAAAGEGPLPRALFMASVRPLPAAVRDRVRRLQSGGTTEPTNPDDFPVELGTQVGFLPVSLPWADMPEGAEGTPGAQGPVATSHETGVGKVNRLQSGLLHKGSVSEALQQIQRQTAAIKHSLVAWGVYRLLLLTCQLAGPQAMLNLVLHVLSKVTTGLSNVPGPDVPLFIAGSRVLGADQFLAGAPVGITVHALSYAGNLNVTVTSHGQTVPADCFARYMLLAWNKLQSEVDAQASTERVRPPAS